MRTKPVFCVLTLVIGNALSGCASLGTLGEDLKNFGGSVIDEAVQQEGDGSPDWGDAVDQVVADDIEDTAEARAERESEMACVVSSYDDFFEMQLRVYADWLERPSPQNAAERAAWRAQDEAIGRELRVCSDHTRRILAGEEPFEGAPDRTTRAMALLMRADDDYQRLRREIFPRFRDWVERMRSVR